MRFAPEFFHVGEVFESVGAREFIHVVDRDQIAVAPVCIRFRFLQIEHEKTLPLGPFEMHAANGNALGIGDLAALLRSHGGIKLDRFPRFGVASLADGADCLALRCRYHPVDVLIVPEARKDRIDEPFFERVSDHQDLLSQARQYIRWDWETGRRKNHPHLTQISATPMMLGSVLAIRGCPPFLRKSARSRQHLWFSPA